MGFMRSFFFSLSLCSKEENDYIKRKFVSHTCGIDISQSLGLSTLDEIRAKLLSQHINRYSLFSGRQTTVRHDRTRANGIWYALAPFSVLLIFTPPNLEFPDQSIDGVCTPCEM